MSTVRSPIVAGRVAEGVVIERRTPMDGAVELVVQHEAAASVQPGQFFQIAVDAPRTLLRRPYSAAWVDRVRGELGFIFNVVGAGSDWLSHLEPGAAIDLLGPFGHGFDLGARRPAVCVAGGLGVAVFPGVVHALRERGRVVTVLLGASTGAQLLPPERFDGAEVNVATDDGSTGHHGSVVDLLEIRLRQFPAPFGDGQGGGTQLFACGPTPMLQSLVRLAERLEYPLASIQVALETPMGCGMGTCLGCVAPRRGGGYLLTCQSGPCVEADELDWSRMADVFHG